MSTQGDSGFGLLSDPAEVLTVTVLGLLFGGTALSMAMGWLDGAVRWLVDNGILVPGSQHPFLVIPGTHGAGLDNGRLMIVASVVALLLVALGDAMVRAHRRRKLEEQP